MDSTLFSFEISTSKNKKKENRSCFSALLEKLNLGGMGPKNNQVEPEEEFELFD